MQDQALNTRYYDKHIMKEGHTDRCRMYHSQPQTAEHPSGCHTLANDQDLNRHYQVAAQILLDICKHYGIKVHAKSWLDHKPNRVTENEQVTILQDSQMIKDRHIHHNKPYIVIKEKQTIVPDNRCDNIQ